MLKVLLCDAVTTRGVIRAGHVFDSQQDPKLAEQLTAAQCPVIDFTESMRPVIEAFRQQRHANGGAGGAPDLGVTLISKGLITL